MIDFEVDVLPSTLGLSPEKFPSFRPIQGQGLNYALDTDCRFKAFDMPTGSGKSLFYVAYALLTGSRVLILTGTKALQDQLLRDFASVGAVDIRGRNNYTCTTYSWLNCEEGAIAGCRACNGGSNTYGSRVAEAREAPIVVTNYTYYMLSSLYGEGLGKFDLLVLDEAHNAADQVCDCASIHITAHEMFRLLRSRVPKGDLPDWITWASENLRDAISTVEQLKAAIQGGDRDKETMKDLKLWSALADKLTRLSVIAKEKLDTWVFEEKRDHKEETVWSIDPLWANEHVERLLFRGIERVMLTSATLTELTLEFMGLTTQDKSHPYYCTLYNFPSVFPTSKSPIYRIDMGFRMSQTTEKDPGLMAQADEVMAQIVEARMDRNGLIHSVSYPRRDRIYDGLSRLGVDILITHDRNNLAAQVQEWIIAVEPRAMISPALTTGYDLAYEACEYTIIPKLPFPDSSSKLVKARDEASKRKYSLNLMAQTLVQMIGRDVRASDDQAEHFILDDNIFWATKVKGLFPSRFTRLITRRDRKALPQPLPKLRRRLQSAPEIGTVEVTPQPRTVVRPIPPPDPAWTPGDETDDDIPF